MEFHLPFGGKLNPANRWVKWEELEEAIAPQFNATIGAPAKPVRSAFGALCIKQRLGLTDEETVDQIRENPYVRFVLGFEGYTSKKPFDPSMMVHFRKRLTDDDLRRINELVVQRGKQMLLEKLEQRSTDEDLDGGSPVNGGEQLALDELIKPSD